jgi:hypothetical protein
LFLALIALMSLFRVFRPTLRHVIATLPPRRVLVVAARRLVVARAALHGHLL